MRLVLIFLFAISSLLSSCGSNNKKEIVTQKAKTLTPKKINPSTRLLSKNNQPLPKNISSNFLLHPESILYSEAYDKGDLGKIDIDGDLESQIYIDRLQGSNWKSPDPKAPFYPEGFNPLKGSKLNRNLPKEGVFYAKNAFSRFNDQDAAYQIAFHLSHYGGMPEDIGDINNDGISDFGNMSHFAYTDNKMYAGECHVWLGSKKRIDTKKQFPDMVIYGDKANGKMCISFTGAGDLNGDGIDDMIMSAAFRDNIKQVRGREKFLKESGSVYVIYGGQFNFNEGKTIEIKAEDIGKTINGVHIGPEDDGSAYLGWANSLESGDINGDGISDFVIGAYNPYRRETDVPHFNPRAYVIFGRKHKANTYGKIWLGNKDKIGPFKLTTIDLPKTLVRCSLCFGVSVIGDINNDGKDEFALGLGDGGEDKRGQVKIFYGKRFSSILKLSDADVTINVSEEPFVRELSSDNELVNKKQKIWARRIEQVRPVDDFNCDGTSDFLVTARSSVQSLKGKAATTGGAAIFFGSKNGLPNKLSLKDANVWIGNSKKGFIGQPAVDKHYDMNGDGCSEVAINDPYYFEDVQGTTQYRGRVWILKGSKNPNSIYLIEDDAAATFVADTKYPGMFGYTWQMGDWNGDGKIDLVVGDHYHGDDYLNIHRGVTFMFYNGYDFNID